LPTDPLIRPVRIGFNRAFRPFVWEADGKPAGPLADHVRTALAEAGMEAAFLPLTLPEMGTALAEGRVDMLLPAGIEAKRAEQMRFSPPIAMTGGAWFAAANGDWPAEPALRASRGAGKTATSPAAGPLLAQLAGLYPELRLVAATDYGDALAQVIAGEVDAAALNLHVGRAQAAAEHPGRFALPEQPFLEIPLALAVAPDDPLGLLSRLAPVLQRMAPAVL